GNAWFFGTQARLAFTERFSVVLEELGIVSLQPNGAVAQMTHRGTGFAEVKIGPQYTFVRNPASGTVAAGRLIFEIPTGSDTVYQGTGTLSLDPYLTLGQTFGRLPGGYGSFNFLGTAGYSFSTNNRRAEFLWMNLHLDYNVAN